VQWKQLGKFRREDFGQQKWTKTSRYAFLDMGMTRYREIKSLLLIFENWFLVSKKKKSFLKFSLL
jgi:hypothetical protein